MAPIFRLLYYLYARRLTRDLRRRPTPHHIGIILDGNRRHGRSLGITEPRDLYDLGAKRIKRFFLVCITPTGHREAGALRRHHPELRHLLLPI